jgi:DNA-binding PadR family transcriptional regulator
MTIAVDAIPIAKATPLRVAVLATIMQRPAHVYDVAQRFEHQFARELCVTIRRVYQVVDDLLAAGIVEEMPDDGRGRRMFRATASGSMLHRRWLVEQMRPDLQDVGMHVGLSAALLQGRDAALDMLGHYEDAVRRDLSTADLLSAVLAPRDVVQELAAEQRRIMLEGALRWATVARERLQRRSAPPPTRLRVVSGGQQ